MNGVGTSALVCYIKESLKDGKVFITPKCKETCDCQGSALACISCSNTLCDEHQRMILCYQCECTYDYVTSEEAPTCMERLESEVAEKIVDFPITQFVNLQLLIRKKFTRFPCPCSMECPWKTCISCGGNLCKFENIRPSRNDILPVICYDCVFSYKDVPSEEVSELIQSFEQRNADKMTK